ncbi:MAG TPA: family 2 glycosyl transferase [Anaerolineaceae bacterium]|uniref:Glycosyltransferase 2-like domain-containing protein n=1 Tax=Anaerolinea thermophila TaxID=167964 RepID=A0A124FN06_9CHLR|nr:MAG: hypothetical protein XD73_0733 [Anaerolinea thermophila]HAF62280.1 family 2 glycosyl transferase [Anaerolineaceae bacterium]
MKALCSIIIRAYNEEKHLGKLLQGIASQTVQPVQVILVDSGSTDRTRTIAQDFGAEIVHIKPDQFTFGRSLNLGIDHAEAEIVIMASAHVYPVYPDWLEKLMEPFKDEKVALVYGKQSGCDTSKFSELQGFRHWYPDVSDYNQDTPFCNNANAAIRKNLWQSHPYDESLTGLEDLAWAKWVKQQGYRIAYSAEAEIVHVHQETWKGVYNRYRREGMAFKHINPEATFSIGEFIKALHENVHNDWREARKQKKLTKECCNVVKFRACQFWGTYQGYRQSGPLTWQLKQTFYYPRTHLPMDNNNGRQGVKPISYEEISSSDKEKESGK